VKWGGPNPDALAALAAARFADTTVPGHDALARLYAARALRAAPLNAAALRILALEAERADDDRAAGALMRIGDRDSRRDLLTQLWLFGNATETRDWPAASRHADALLRQEWTLAATVYPVMILALKDPRAAGPFADRLRARPDWRRTFLKSIAVADPPGAARLFEALAAAGDPPTEAESGVLVGRLVAQGDYGGARAEWLRLLPHGAPVGRDLIYDGGFLALPGASPFNWRLISADGANAELGKSADGASALHVQAPAARTAALAEQLLVLPPGPYRLSGKVRIEAAPSDDRFSWRVACAGRPDTALGEARQAPGAQGWRPFTADFTVPASGCPAQWLRLDGLAHEGFETTEAWYRSLRVTPLASASPAPDG
ncbi:MAG TPA: hypothetical protein VIB82_01840, partial [Caulobacteraceae bacterium]